MTSLDSTRKYLLALMLGFFAIGFVFSQMDADIAVGLVGDSVRGVGNQTLRAEVGGVIQQVHVSEGDLLKPGDQVISLDATDTQDEILSLKAEILGIETLIKSKTLAKGIYQKEVKSVTNLVKKGLEPKSALRKAEVDLALSDAALIEAQGQLAVNQSHLERLNDRLERYKVKSAVSGQLLKLHRYASGDVLKAGDLIGEIVPDEGALSFEAKVDPSDIASVRVGYPAKVTLRAVNRYEVKPLYGQVSYVSPASIEAEDGSRYFIARITLDEGNQLLSEGLVSDVGHTADISVKSGQRSVLAFVLSPLVRGAERVFQER